MKLTSIFNSYCVNKIKRPILACLSVSAVFLIFDLSTVTANPFADVPNDHWAYDSIAKLAKNGVIAGYGNGTYFGDKALTRYELAQMVARAMTVKNVDHADKVEVTKLAAEFSDELQALGTRVETLEKKVNNLKFSGSFIYTYQTSRLDSLAKPDNLNQLQLKLDMNTDINDHWQGRAQLAFPCDMDSAKNVTDTDIKQIYVTGKYSNWQIKAGNFGYTTEADSGMVFDDNISGVQIEYCKDINVKLMSGRFEYDVAEYKYRTADKLNDDKMDITGLELYSNRNRLTWGIGYHRVKSRNIISAIVKGNSESYDIFSVGGSYQIAPELVFKAAYARSSNISKYVTNAARTAYNAELFYRGADPDMPGSWGAWIAYRHLGNAPCVATTYESIRADEKGINIGVEAALAKNMLGYLEFFKGKLVGDDDFNEQRILANTPGYNIFARVTVLF